MFTKNLKQNVWLFAVRILAECLFSAVETLTRSFFFFKSELLAQSKFVFSRNFNINVCLFSIRTLTQSLFFVFSDRFHVRSSGHPRHQRPASPADRLPAREVHEGDQESEDRDHSLRHHEEEVQGLQRHTAASSNAEFSLTGI